MRIHDSILGLIIFVGGILIAVHSSSFPSQFDGKPGPALFPMVLGGLFSICGLILAIKGFRQKDKWIFKKTIEFRPGGIFNMLAVMVAVVFYVLCAETLGFLITMTVILLVQMLLLKTKPVMAVITAIGGAVVIYLIFAKGLLVPLPEGLIYF